MALSFDVNDPSFLTGTACVYKFKTLCKSVGWTVPSSGDGLSAFSSSSDVITGSGSGANGLGNTSAWIRLQSPAGAGTRELTIQRGGSDLIWTVKYSYSAGFTGGSPSATVAGTATDSQTLLSAASWFQANGSYRVACAADSSAPYGLYMFTALVGGGSFTSGSQLGAAFLLDPLVAGSFPSADVDPVMFYASASGFTLSGVAGSLGYLKKGLAGEGFVNIPWLTANTATAAVLWPASAGNNSHSFTDHFIPVPYARDSGVTAPVGWKGVSSMLQWAPLIRNIGHTFTKSTTRDLVLCGDHFALPWNGSKFLF